MKTTNLLIGALLLLAVVLGLTTYLQKTRQQPAEVVQITEAPVSPPPEPVKYPIVHYAVPEPAAVTAEEPAMTESEKIQAESAQQPKEPMLPKTLPRVQASDTSIISSLSSLIPDRDLFRLLRLENFIQRLVSTIDNLPESRLPKDVVPLLPPEGKFRVKETRENIQIAPDNAKRYTPYLNILKTTRQDYILTVYIYFYPLFQEAYRQLGYQNAYFNDRLVYVIDHLLQTPDPADPLTVQQPVVLYTYTDPLLENLSAGQKILLRMGRQQRLEVLDILKSYRLRLISLPVQQ